MNFLTDSGDLATALLLLTFIPMIVTGVFFVLCFHRAGYGPIGKLLVGGFVMLLISLFFGLMFSIERDTTYRTIAGFTRVGGWSMIAAAGIVWFIELDRSLP